MDASLGVPVVPTIDTRWLPAVSSLHPPAQYTTHIHTFFLPILGKTDNQYGEEESVYVCCVLGLGECVEGRMLSSGACRGGQGGQSRRQGGRGRPSWDAVAGI